MMTKKEIISQLESIIDNAKDFCKDPDHDDVWEKDIECCKFCINLVEQYVEDKNELKRMVKVDNVYGTENKYILQSEYNGFGIYNRKTPNGYFVHQDWLITNGNGATLVVEPYNSICEEELFEMIDNYNETKKFGVKAVRHCGALHMHPSGSEV